MTTHYPIGRPGIPWSDDEKKQWFEMQSIKRTYQDEVLHKLPFLPSVFKSEQYGALPIDTERYPLMAITPVNPDPALPYMLITGGVHGYETSGVQGALDFALNHAQAYSHLVNLIILPCISPWGYETINRWGANAVDPNRSFTAESDSFEAKAALQYVKALSVEPIMHIDLHETTDTDNSEFRPALSARDAVEQAVWQIPDGFYLVADSQAPEIDFQKAIIKAVEQVTHIADADDKGNIIGAPILYQGVIGYDKKALNLCAGMTNARFVTTTEVYPDSPRTDAKNCIDAQVAAIKAAVDFALERGV
ncbi:DUF2817 domain-containing protein [Alteromonas sediminis]|uniref:DUF2817 domain-containing protein n=1 Tax=Alteromonas sediminis TaxID=2259342 RepID=A0A3N5ZBF9_9ALTE|nr:M14 family metallocarboxypeptidase [Alteromonas sediminis]RPJ68644.1 DUF2817 domain-containing protein [Alteromonas sediminis]